MAAAAAAAADGAATAAPVAATAPPTTDSIGAASPPSAAAAADTPPDTDAATPHHERQSWLLCGLHTVNAVLQDEFGPKYVKSDLDAICDELDPPAAASWFHFNAHRHWAGAGDYDANVLLAALQRRGLETAYHDARRGIRDNVTLGAGIRPLAFIVNVPPGGLLSLFRGRHWYALRSVRGVWWDCNSSLSAPERVGGWDEVLTALQAALDGGASVLLVTRAATGAGAGTATSSS